MMHLLGRARVGRTPRFLIFFSLERTLFCIYYQYHFVYLDALAEVVRIDFYFIWGCQKQAFARMRTFDNGK
jgi:hypothetical protein